MSDNTSDHSGYLTPVGAAPVEAATLDAVITTLIRSITGIDGTLVRPRWQREPASQPAWDTDWVAMGIEGRRMNPHNFERISDSQVILWRTGELDVMLSIYGPNCQANAEVIRDCLSINQNLDLIYSQGIKVLGVGDVRAVPELTNMNWVNRCDMTITFARATGRTYNIFTLLSAAGTVTANGGSSATYDTTKG